MHTVVCVCSSVSRLRPDPFGVHGCLYSGLHRLGGVIRSQRFDECRCGYFAKDIGAALHEPSAGAMTRSASPLQENTPRFGLLF